MAGVTLRLDKGNVLQQFTHVLALFEDPRLMFADMGEFLLIAHRARFEQEVSPEGEPWQQLTPRYKKWKERKRPGIKKLVFDNLMKGTLRYQVDSEGLSFGTDRVYGAIHQFGGRPWMAPGPAAIPARPWLGTSAADDQRLVEMASDHVRRVLGGR